MASHQGARSKARALLAAAALTICTAASDTTYIDLGLGGSVTYTDVVAAQVCAGLFNRDDTVAGPVYALIDHWDSDWLESIDGVSNPLDLTEPVNSFLSRCLAGDDSSPPVAKGYIRYNASSQKAILPNIVTLAAVLDAVPLEDGDAAIGDAPMLFDTLTLMRGFSPYDATKYMFENYANQTSTLSKMNPGYDQGQAKHHPFNPPLTGTANMGLTDFIVKEKLFNFYLVKGCVPGTDEYALQSEMAASNIWPTPITVYGYDDTIPIAGDLFEAETDCNREHNMGQVASSGVSNLAYFSRKPAITTPQVQNPPTLPPDAAYDSSKTYFSIVIGDGDNLAFVKGSRRSWMLERQAKCAAEPDACFPLLWSLSPNLIQNAPQMMQWYYNVSYNTTHDYFVLPPSGHLYSYPGEMSADDQQRYVTATERDCELMSTSASVHWEWFGTWSRAISNFMPQYAVNNIVKGLFPVNVPYLFPMAEGGWGRDHYKVIDGSVVLFKPKEWRGTACAPAWNCPTAQGLADEISGYQKGTITHIYMTSDGGCSYNDVVEMVSLLADHVELVDHETLINMALQRG